MMLTYAGTPVKLLGEVATVVEEARAWGARLAIASRTDEPSWVGGLITISPSISFEFSLVRL